MPGSPAADLIRITEQCATGCANNGNIANLTYRSPNFGENWQGSYNWRASASYVLGAQNMKFGYQGGYLVDNRKAVFQQPGAELPDAERRARPDHGNHRSLFAAAARALRRRLRTGGVDARPDDAAGRAAPRYRVQHLPRGANRRRPVPARRHDIPGNQGRGRVPGPDAAGRRRLRSLRQRQDGAQGQLRPLPGSRAERGTVRREPADVARLDDGDPDLDRRQSQLDGGLRPPEQRRAGSARGRRRLLRRGRQYQFRQVGLRYDAGSGAALRVGRAIGRLADWRLGAAAVAAARVSRPRLLPALARKLRRHRQSHAEADQLRSVHDFRADRLAAARTAAVMRFQDRSTTSTRAWHRRRPTTL